MKMSVFAFVSVFMVSSVLCDDASPIGKVTTMLADLSRKIIAEGQNAQKVYDEVSEWCEDQQKDLSFSIKTAKAELAEHKAVIDDEVAKSESYTQKIEDLTAGIAGDEGDLRAAVDVRAKEAADFNAEEKELLDTIDTLKRAVSILEKQARKGGASMLQTKNAQSMAQLFATMIQASMFSTADASRLTALVQSAQQDSDEDADAGAPSAAVYKGQSGDIIETLGGLMDKAESQLSQARQQERKAQGDFALLKQSLEDEIKVANRELDETRQSIGASAERKATAEGDSNAVRADLREDTGALAKLHRNCMAKAEEFQTVTKSRGEELAALAKAKAIIMEATSMAQVSFLQVEAGRSRIASSVDLANFEAVRVVRNLAKKEHSKALAQLAMRMASAVHAGARVGDDPFAKVKSMVREMIKKLEEQGASEATQKAYCDKELAESTAKKDKKKDEIEKVSVHLDQMRSRSAQLKTEVADLQNSLSELARSQATMDELRAKEKGQFDEDAPELEKGIIGVRKALGVLKDYYAGGGAAHGSADGAASGIIGMLELIEGDFMKNLADLKTVEERSKMAYEQESQENEVEKATKEKDVEHKRKEVTSLDRALAETTSDRSGIQAELDAVADYLSKIEAQCTVKAESYEEGQRRRQAEIDGLKEALSILDNQAAALVELSRKQSLRLRLRA